MIELSLASIVPGGEKMRLPIAREKHTRQAAIEIFRQLAKIHYSLTMEFRNILSPAHAHRVGYMAKLYNRKVKKFKKLCTLDDDYKAMLGDWGLPNCSAKVAEAIVNIANIAAIPNTDVLNRHYKPFSSEVYGETNLSQMRSICDELGIGPHDVFADLGSGVGQLVCFTSAYTGCKKAVGIELAAVPAGYAKEMEKYYKRLMLHFNKAQSPIELIHGSFLDEKHRILISEATVIFMNNYAFDPKLMNSIQSDILMFLNASVKIITTMPLGKVKGAKPETMNQRKARDFCSFCESEPLISVPGGVSWTNKPVTFYKNTVNQEKIYQSMSKQNRSNTLERV